MCTTQVERGLAAVTYLRKQVGLQHLPTVQQQQQDAPNSGGGGTSKAGQKFMQGLLAKAQTQVLCMYTTSLLSYCCCF
jgi:hypothetical protein